MHDLGRFIGAIALAATLATGAPAQTFGPGGAVIVAVTPPPGARVVPGGAVSPERLNAAPADVRGVRAGSRLVAPARGTFEVATPPPGYRRAWDDDRVNPLRGPRTLQGDAQSDGVWTRQSPRRLRPVIQVRR